MIRPPSRVLPIPNFQLLFFLMKVPFTVSFEPKVSSHCKLTDVSVPTSMSAYLTLTVCYSLTPSSCLGCLYSSVCLSIHLSVCFPLPHEAQTDDDCALLGRAHFQQLLKFRNVKADPSCCCCCYYFRQLHSKHSKLSCLLRCFELQRRVPSNVSIGAGKAVVAAKR